MKRIPKRRTLAGRQCALLAIAALLIPSALPVTLGRSTSRHPTQEPTATECPAGDRAYDGNCVTDPTLVLKTTPKYPKKAKRNGVEARITLKAVIQKTGSVVDLVVEKCTAPGYGFEAAAVDAVRRWRYVPARVNGEISDVSFTVVVEFKLR